ncbi:MAG: TIGR03790 family protein [Tepidisphaeraceae bacterium]
MKRLAWAVFVLQLAAVAQARLQPADLLLVTNQNVPASIDLARHYAEVRHVPAERILSLTLPAADDLPVAEYDAKVAAPIRTYLASQAGAGVRCIVLFYGVPLRVGGDPSNPANHAELGQLRKLVSELDQKTPAIADAAEAVAKKMGLTPQPITGTGTRIARARVESAARQIQQAINNIPDRNEQQKILEQLGDVRTKMTAVAEAALESAFPGISASSDSEPAKLPDLLKRPRDAGARSTVRRRVATFNGAFALYEVAEQQIAFLDTDETDASLDSELSLVNVGDYPRYRWQINSFYYKVPGPNPKALMVSRIDAPTRELAKAIIDDSLAAEQQGLTGGAVFDSRGIAPPKNNSMEGYGWFDQAIRDAAGWFEVKTKIRVTRDDRAQVLPPQSVSDVALYCGWYSLRNYIPSCTFNRGAVAYHVASFELLSMHNPAEKGWVPNLLKDHVAATLGPVSEPYLTAFPRPDEFFPLLLTGKLTLAEVYWRTCPMASWKMTLVGDPLYRPYATSPPITPG